jgi:hypothetical protein
MQNKHFAHQNKRWQSNLTMGSLGSLVSKTSAVSPLVVVRDLSLAPKVIQPMTRCLQDADDPDNLEK